MTAPTTSERELRDLAHFKRLLELWEGDTEFRERCREPALDRRALLARHGLDLADAELEAFWPLAALENRTGPEAQRLVAAMNESPLGRRWVEWQAATEAAHTAAARARFATGNPRFDAWRARQRARTLSEAYVPAIGEDYWPPLFAFELSSGCSKQCWFCAFSPEKLTRNFDYTPENRALWRDVLRVGQALFGNACQYSGLYHATEPSDNPDYLEFVTDFHAILGAVPQTTTADPLKNLDWTRRMLALRDLDPTTADRFSILTPKALRGVHAAFTPEALREVSLVLHNKGSIGVKNECGRAIENDALLGRSQDMTRDMLPEGKQLTPQLTLECLVGYLVNMVDHTIKLISPCNESAQWPKGYIVHAEGRFTDAASFRAFVEDSIGRCAREKLGAADRLGFRRDLVFEKLDGGFGLVARYKRHKMRGNPHFGTLGELLRTGTYTAGEVVQRLTDEGMPAPQAASWLEKLYQRGLLAES
ncbi:MAG: radical SAM family RiPP maturation amino acid epimerase [Gammaproteobacteria bacterium]|nr:radical SAM family RiPP maturation amino acid epimerase [Gammaproteobacteria bacterium]